MHFTKAYCPRCGGEETVQVEIGGVERHADLFNERETNVRLEVSFYTATVPHQCKAAR